MTTFPPGFRLVLDPGVRRIDGGRTLVGGTPTRILRLTDAGARMIDGWTAGEPVPDGHPAAARLARRLLDGALAHPRPRGPAPTADDVTVVIPVRDDAAGLDRTVAALGGLTVVVVDDGSREPVPGAAVRHDTALGPAAARQSGWRVATTPIVAFVDADVEPEPGWLDAVLAHFADEEVGAVAPRVLPRRAAGTPEWLAAYEAVRSPLDLGGWEAPVRPRSRVPYVPTATLLVRRLAIADVGGFDADLRVGEDVDLVWRLHHAGWTVRYEPAARVTHPGRAGARAWLRQRYDYGSSAAALTARHGSAVAPLAVSPWSAAAWGLAVAGQPVAGAAVALVTTGYLASQLDNVDRPYVEAVRLAGVGNALAARSVADAIRRPWWPFAAAAAWRFRRSRPALAAAVLVPPLVEWRRDLPALDPARYAALRLADDLAYGLGVWAGCLRARDFAALRPAFDGGT